MKYAKKLGAVRAARKLQMFNKLLAYARRRKITAIDEASIMCLSNTRLPQVRTSETRSAHEVVQLITEIQLCPHNLRQAKALFTGEQA